jgi:translation initiation factor 3 subunit I
VCAVSPPVMKLVPPTKGRITRAVWGPLNRTLISCGEDGNLYKWDVETGKVVQTVVAHEKMVQDLEMSADGTCFLTASLDKSAKVGGWVP